MTSYSRRITLTFNSDKLKQVVKWFTHNRTIFIGYLLSWKRQPGVEIFCSLTSYVQKVIYKVRFESCPVKCFI